MSILSNMIRSLLGLSPDDPERLAMMELQRGSKIAEDYLASDSKEPLRIFPMQDPSLVMVCNTCLDSQGRPRTATGCPTPEDAQLESQEWYRLHPYPGHDSHVTYRNERRRGDRRRV